MSQTEQVRGASTPEGDNAGLVSVQLPIPQEITPNIPSSLAEQTQLDPRYQRTQTGIVVPSGYSPDSKGIFLLPARATPEIATATEKDQARFSQKQHETPNQAERTRAIFAPGVFLASKIGPSDAAHIEVVNNLAAQNSTHQQATFTEAGIHRKAETVRSYDKNADAPTERTVVRPSALEDVSLAILDTLSDVDIRGAEAHVVLQPILKLVRGYNMHNAAGQTLELPGLRERILTTLAGDTFAEDKNRDARYVLYSILESIDADTSAAHRESLLWSMSNRQDLDHPLAAKHTFALATEQPQSTWITAQQELRRHILTLLGGSNQQAFDSFQQLYELSRGLVFHGDPLDPEAGKIGIDMECRFPDNLRRSVYTPSDAPGMATSDNYTMRVPGLEKNWTYHLDGRNDELARGDNRLEHSADYPTSLVELYEWLNKNHVRVVGWHLHLDREQHPHTPTLGNILISTNGLQAIRENDLGSHEIRALQAPHDREAGYAGGKRALVPGINIHPARMDDIIGLYIYASDQPDRFQYDEKIDIATGTHLSTEQLLWGHFAGRFDSPEGRLAALMALHEPDAFASFNPVAFLNSYQAASLGRVADCLSTSLRRDADIEDKTSRQTIQDMLTLVRAAAEGRLANAYDAMEHGIAKITLTQTLDANIPGNWDIYAQLIDSNELRHVAVDALLRRPEQNAAYLAPVLQIKDFYGRSRVFDVIVPYLSDTDSILEEALTSDDYALAQSALQLATNQPGRHQQVIRQILAHDNPNAVLFRYTAFNTLCKNPVAAHDLIAPYLQDPSGQFFHIVFSAAGQHPAEFRSELLGLLNSEAGSYIKGQAVAALGHDRTENHAVLADSLQSDDYAVATSALQAVLPYAEEFIPDLERALQSGNYTVQTGAATYFAQHADMHMPLLEKILQGQDATLQQAVLPVFTADPVKHEHILNQLRQSPNSSLRQAAVEAFAQDPQLFRGVLLEELASDQNSYAAATALTALAKDPQNTELFRARLEDPYVSWDTLAAVAGGDPAIRQLLPTYLDRHSFVPSRAVQTLLEKPAENLTILEQLIEKVQHITEDMPQIEATLVQASEDNPALVEQLLASNTESFRHIAEREVMRHPRRYPNFAPQILASANPEAQLAASPDNTPPIRPRNGIISLLTAPFRLFNRRSPGR